MFLQDNQNDTDDGDQDQDQDSTVAPSLLLPKGGGAIRGIDEKLAVNPATGTAALNLAIPVSPGRAGFSPELTLAYDSGNGNGPFGLGWALSTPSIRRKTARGLPRYQDERDSDTFVLSSSEDLVPELVENESGWQSRIHRDPSGEYRICRYRPRTEESFARIELWIHAASGDQHWRTTSRENVTRIYGRSQSARIADPDAPARIYQWLLEEIHHPHGHLIQYEYKAEDTDNIAPEPAEQHRLDGRAGFTNRYLKRIRYGNGEPYVAGDWRFEVVFDYGEHEGDTPTPREEHPWPRRADAFSSYRAGFEIRSYRLCRRILMFHRFAELGDNPLLVRSTAFEYRESPVASYLQRIQLHGHSRTDSGVSKIGLPPLVFGYQQPELHTAVQTLRQEGQRHAVATMPRSGRWVDLDGEGLPGLLSEEGNAWRYRQNRGEGRLAAPRTLAAIPGSASLESGERQLLDLAGDGQTDVVELEHPTGGFHERTRGGGWKGFRSLESQPNLSWGNPDLRFVDLDGDGHADVMITENDVISWHRSRGETGFSDRMRTRQTADEDHGPALLFADGTETLFLADFSGDGLSDLARIRNGEVCYWPNLGYGRFGAKISMAGAPVFDRPDLFDPARLRLADIDGSGPTDILYLHGTHAELWFNQSGNTWSERHPLSGLPGTDHLSRVTVTDLLGTGTACLVWSSPLPGDATQPIRFIDLMGSRKPHLLLSMDNQRGAETTLAYAPSTQFYLADREAGQPWITRLPFPVQVVTSVIKRDLITGNRLVTEYDYHHGYFDGEEREFRGFGRVEQRDTETLAHTAADGGGASAAADQSLQLPPVRTVSWFHTGAWIQRDRIARLYAGEYYAGDADAALLPDTLLPAGLSPDEAREAARALKGRMLRREVYADDDSAARDQPYTVTETSHALRLVQPRAGQPHAVFHAHRQQSLVYHYERHSDDPRLVHSLTLGIDPFGNVTRSVSIAYPGREPRIDEQARARITCSETDFINKPDEADFYRIGVASEQRTQELTALESAGLDPDPRRPLTDNVDIQTLNDTIDAAESIAYEQSPDGITVQKRLIERKRTRYRRDDLSGPLPLNDIQSLALPWETYRQVFTPGLLSAVYGPRIDDTLLEQGGYTRFPEDDDDAWWIPSGRRDFAPEDPGLPAGTDRGTFARQRFYLPVAHRDPFGNITRVSHDDHLLLLERVEDPLGNVLRVRNDYRVLKPVELTDPNGNRSAVAFDALGRVSGSAIMGSDAGEGDNLDSFEADPAESDIEAFLADPVAQGQRLLGNATTRIVYDPWAFVRSRVAGTPLQPGVVSTLSRETHAADLTADEVTRIQYSLVYHDGFGREVLTKARAEPGPTPVRDPDTRALIPGDDGETVLWTNEVDWAEDNTTPRWVGTGRTVHDNKGNPVKQYEPFFSDTHHYEDEARLVHWGVTPILRRDPLGRVVRTDNPDGTFSRVEFDPWRQATWDESDTLLESGNGWYEDRERPGRDLSRLPSDPEQRAAALAAEHAGTPTVAHLDTLGRPVLSIAHNREVRRDMAGGITAIHEQRIPTRTEQDIEGQMLLIRDGRHIEDEPDADPLTYTGGNPVMEYRVRGDGSASEVIAPGYDLAGRQLYQRSMDAGERWTLPDVAGNPLYSWDSRGQRLRHHYDALRRPTHLFVRNSHGDDFLAERTVYGEHHPEAGDRNLRGRIHRQYDGAGVVINEAFDFKGNLLRSRRRLAAEYRDTPDWSPLADLTDIERIDAAAVSLVEGEVFESRTTYDALDRSFESTTPDGSITRNHYNEAGLLESVDVRLRAATEWTPFLVNIDYNAKGQRTAVRYGNGVITRYEYDPRTFRLVRMQSTREREPNRLQDLSYTYDPVGNITEIRDAAQQTVYHRNDVIEPHSRYAYDALYRLIRATGRELLGGVADQQRDQAEIQRSPHPNDTDALRRYTEIYSYDVVGNIARMAHRAEGAHWTRRYRYADDSNRLLATSRPGDPDEGPFTDTYDYNIHGSMKTMPHLPDIQWDFREQMQQADLGGGGRVYFTYDASGQRVRKVHEHNGTTVDERIYLGSHELYRRRVGGDLRLERETLHVMDDQQRIVLVETKTGEGGELIEAPLSVFRYQLSNHLGSASVEVDNDGRVISYEEYHPYGTTSFYSMRSDTDLSLKRYRFTGNEHDQETALAYHNARYYAPWTGRWASPDPAGLIDGQNLYRYARNRPSVVSDVDGQDPVENEYRVPPQPGGIRNPNESYSGVLTRVPPERDNTESDHASNAPDSSTRSQELATDSQKTASGSQVSERPPEKIITREIEAQHSVSADITFEVEEMNEGSLETRRATAQTELTISKVQVTTHEIVPDMGEAPVYRVESTKTEYTISYKLAGERQLESLTELQYKRLRKAMAEPVRWEQGGMTPDEYRAQVKRDLGLLTGSVVASVTYGVAREAFDVSNRRAIELARFAKTVSALVNIGVGIRNKRRGINPDDSLPSSGFEGSGLDPNKLR